MCMACIILYNHPCQRTGISLFRSFIAHVSFLFACRNFVVHILLLPEAVKGDSGPLSMLDTMTVQTAASRSDQERSLNVCTDSAAVAVQHDFTFQWHKSQFAVLEG